MAFIEIPRVRLRGDVNGLGVSIGAASRGKKFIYQINIRRPVVAEESGVDIASLDWLESSKKVRIVVGIEDDLGKILIRPNGPHLIKPNGNNTGYSVLRLWHFGTNLPFRTIPFLAEQVLFEYDGATQTLMINLPEKMYKVEPSPVAPPASVVPSVRPPPIQTRPLVPAPVAPAPVVLPVPTVKQPDFIRPTELPTVKLFPAFRREADDDEGMGNSELSVKGKTVMGERAGVVTPREAGSAMANAMKQAADKIASDKAAKASKPNGAPYSMLDGKI